MKVLITGHLGLIGKSLVRAFQKEGHEVYGVDRQTGADCRNLFKHNDDQYDVVIHAAGITPSEGGSRGVDLLDAVSLDVQFFEWAKRTEQSCIVFFSGAAAYPDHLQNEGYRLRETDLDLDMPSAPSNTFGWTKFMGEICAQTALQDGLNVQVFRPFEVCGPGVTNAIGRLAERIKMRQDPLVVYGDNEDVRDIIHVDDVVQTVFRSLEIGFDHRPTNLCRGLPVSMRDLVDEMLQIAEWQPSMTIWVGREDSGHVVGDPFKQNMLWIPRTTHQDVIQSLLNS